MQRIELRECLRQLGHLICLMFLMLEGELEAEGVEKEKTEVLIFYVRKELMSLHFVEPTVEIQNSRSHLRPMAVRLRPEFAFPVLSGSSPEGPRICVAESGREHS